MTRRKAQDKGDERDRRAERLAAALKQNLKRRKTQARGRAADEAVPVEPVHSSVQVPDKQDR